MPLGKTPVEDVACENIFHYIYRNFVKETKAPKKRRTKSKSLPVSYERTPEPSGRRHSWCLSNVPDEQFYNALYTANASTQTSSTSSLTRPSRLFQPIRRVSRQSRLELHLDERRKSFVDGVASTSRRPDTPDVLSPPSPVYHREPRHSKHDISNLSSAPGTSEAWPKPNVQFQQEKPSSSGYGTSESWGKPSVHFQEEKPIHSSSAHGTSESWAKPSVHFQDEDPIPSSSAHGSSESRTKPNVQFQEDIPIPPSSAHETSEPWEHPNIQVSEETPTDYLLENLETLVYRLLKLTRITSISDEGTSEEVESKVRNRNFFSRNELHSPKRPYKEFDLGEYFDCIPTKYLLKQYGIVGSPFSTETMMNSLIEDKHRKIIIEFCHLLEKAKQLFNGLRELPQYGHKQWHSYFGRTFDVYTKLWKFQQLHRAILDTKYGLKRWQIGEIASKIGQLYYHFYLRTSETAYLNEAYSFYSAIRGRSYYTQASKEDRSELLVKKLRYYARFIVVCLLLKKNQLVRDLVHELDHQVKEYGKTYDPDDQVEWILVLDEIVAFLEADHVITVKRPDGVNVIISNRLNPLNTYPLDKTSQMTLSLQEIVVVGSYDQVKFSELTMDMFRMLQTLEKEPDAQVQDESSRQRFIPAPNISNQGYDLESLHHTNTHKYLLFKPSPTQILVYLSSGCHDLPPNGALLLYISAEGNKVPGKLEASGYEAGGLITTSRSDINRDTSRVQEPQPGPSSAPVAPTSATQSKYKEARCLYPGDLVPYTRRPMFIIIESDNSYVFQQIPRHFGQPLIIMMSPIELPERLENKQHDGNLFTLFLHSPLAAVCYLSDIVNFTLAHWERAMKIIDNFMTEACIIMMRTRIDPAFNAFIGDDFFRVLLLRFIFCEVTIRRHRGFRARNQHPRILPALPEEIYDNAALNYFVLELADHLQIGTFFDEPIVHPAIKP